MAQEGSDWTTDLLDRLDHVIELVRSNTTDRLVKVARVVVFGLMGAIVGTMVAVIAVIGIIRLLNEMLPSGVWLPDMILGAIFVAFGLFAWAKAHAPAPA